MLRLILILAIGKAIVILAVSVFDPSSAIRGLGTKWDSNYYEIIASQGYNAVSAPYVFSPVYPALIRLASFFVGNAWVSALLITNALSFVFPILLYKAFGYRTALLAEVFPTYLVFTTVAYSDVVALVFLASAVLLLMRDKVVRSSLALSGAILTFYNLAWTLPSFLLALVKEKSATRWLFFVAPLVAGGVILLWFKLNTGEYFPLMRLEAPWQVALANPWTQVQYLLCPRGQGTFTCQPWPVLGIFLPPTYWVVRNLLFEGFYVLGALYLFRVDTKQRAFLCLYSFSVIVPLLFLIGFPALSIPRLLLPAFPVFAGYARVLDGAWRLRIYVALCLGMAAFVSIIQYFALFA